MKFRYILLGHIISVTVGSLIGIGVAALMIDFFLN